MAEKETQYKWRQRKKRNTMLGAWIIAVILVAAIITFVYEGTRGGDPLMVAKAYVEDVVGTTDYTVETGTRSLNNDNQFVQEYTFSYTADGKEETRTLDVVQQSEKKFGVFEQWSVDAAVEGETVDFQLIAPADSQVLVNGVAPGEDSIQENAGLSPGAVCYQLTGVSAEDCKIQVNGLPFDSYETTLDPTSSVLDVRDQLVVGENAQTQMSEIGKQIINELFTAAVDDKGADSLGTLFDGAANKSNLYKAIHDNLYEDGELKVSSLTFDGFSATFGDVYYPGTEEESYIGIEMKLSYTCSYEPSNTQESETETEEETEAETEEGAETETETGSSRSATREATFYFKYTDGNCTATTIEVPNAIS